MAAHEHREFGCRHHGSFGGAAAREPFAFPGTERRYAPDRTVDVRHMRLEIALDPEVIAIRGAVTHEFTALGDDTQTVLLHAGELTVDRVSGEAGEDLSFRHVGEDLTITLPRALAYDEPGAVTVHYRGTPRRGMYFIRPDAGYPEKAYEAWTQSQDEDGRYWVPCFDHPTEKFSSEILARVPAKYTAVSNGALQGKTEYDDGTVTWHWKQEAEHSAYLLSLCVGDYEEILLGDDPVPMPAYVPRGKRAIAERAFGRTAAMVRHFSERFGVDYPYEKYAQVVVQDFIFGGMENTSATTLIDLVLYDDRAALDYDLDDLVAHELAHQWWGDLLTCREWPHAWLNEGFATWSQALWKEHAESPDEEALERYGWLQNYLGEDAREYRRAIVDRRYVEPIDLFDRHLYEKGGLVLHMLRKDIGEDAFWRAIKTYAESNRGGSVVTEDLRVAFEEATGRNIDGFLDQWVYHAGHPELTVSWKHDEKTGLLDVSVKQTQKTQDGMVDAFRFPLTIQVDGAESVEVFDGERTVQADFRHHVEVTRREHTFHIPCDKAPSQVVVDPDGDVLATWKLEQPTAASRATLASDAPLIARIRAAHALEKEPTAENVAALAAQLTTSFWGLAVECAAALGAMRTPAARDALLAALPACEHPKARKGIVAALGSFRHDEEAGAALRGVLEQGDPSLFVEAAAAKALGQTRVEGAHEVLTKALADKDSWYEWIRIGCIQGLAELGSDAVVPTLTECTAYGRHVRLRAAAAMALGQVGKRMLRRDAILETLADLADEGEFRVVLGVCSALRALGDAGGIAILEGPLARHTDGIVLRYARAAAFRLRKGAGDGTQVARLSDEVEKLRKQNAELVERMEKLEARLAGESGGNGGD